tara:strand:- start:213 stop:524 length:312 start_codon:yes stop_codon:yes gene_type:complete
MRKRKKNKSKSKKYFICFLIVMCSLVLISNDFGLIQLIKLKQSKKHLQNNIHMLLEQQIKLNKEIVELKTNTDYIEKIAREKFMMAKPGEKVFKVSDYKDIKK